MDRRRRRGLLAVLSGALALTALTGAGGLREDEIECEQASSHLSDCCPGFDEARVDCHYIQGCDKTSEPSLGVAESQCIEALGCDEVRARGLCTRVGVVTNSPTSAAPPDAGATLGADGGVLHEPVCP